MKKYISASFLCILIISSICLRDSGGYKLFLTDSRDNSALSVEVISPSNNSIVHGSVIVKINSTASGAVNNSTNFTTWLTIDGAVVNVWLGLGIFNWTWDTRGYPDGAHEVTAYVNDSEGNNDSCRIFVRVSNSFLNISISSPFFREYFCLRLQHATISIMFSGCFDLRGLISSTCSEKHFAIA